MFGHELLLLKKLHIAKYRTIVSCQYFLKLKQTYQMPEFFSEFSFSLAHNSHSEELGVIPCK